ncbi:MAG TPA: type VI secretion system contractile sheath small subunit [Gemmatales bacterium]|nr:type VI secretion system contractile sheath small subunit [Gemmatales bacterium]
MSESNQKKIGRVRRPRVQISYDVETNGAMQKKELPYVVGVLADLSAQRTEPLPELKFREFVNIDRDNLNEVLKKAAPEISIRVDNKLSDDGTVLSVPLKFRNMDDFHPAQIADQVPALKELLDMRKRLDVVLGKIGANSKLEGLLQEVLANTAKVEELAKQMGIAAEQPASPTEGK